MSQSEEETQIEVPKYKTFYNELSQKVMDTIVIIASQQIKENRLEKDAALQIVTKLRENEKLENLGKIIRTRRMAMLCWQIFSSLIEF